MSAGKKWYVIHTYSGHEEKVRDALRHRIEQSGLTDQFGDILIPGKPALEQCGTDATRPRRKLRLPGYIFVEMELNERVLQLVKETPKVTGFVGSQTPQEVPLPAIEDHRPGIVRGRVKPKPTLH